MTRFALLTATLMGTVAPAAFAAPAVGLVGDKTLVMFDTETLTVSGTTTVSGVDALVGIDLRPANNSLVGVTPDGEIVTIDTATGAASKLSMMDTPLPMVEGAPVIVDFNPMADRLRFMSGTTNHRVNVDTGEVTVDGSLAFEGNDMHAGEAPMIAAAAYINSHGKPDTTAMFDIDSTIVALIQQTSPNDGTLAAVGKLGIETPGAVYGFDIASDAEMNNNAWLVTNNILYEVDLETGAAEAVAEIGGLSGEIRDIAVMPAM
ncbi:DUF4394 domain-containing protein [Falsirhodobacter sp. alg1]|uniref:DUF4394 domain-containing protein n=1 Tax=Falsirhodobacter sp. alg1 TaxID=1472418 RepID=UPI0005F05012|nr:DUF4394 domain-containing protein [Falsirhodobacter sp. alg1]